MMMLTKTRHVFDRTLRMKWDNQNFVTRISGKNNIIVITLVPAL